MGYNYSAGQILELQKYSKEEIELVTDYLSTWTESKPPYYPDGTTMYDRAGNAFHRWASDKYGEDIADAICEEDDWVSYTIDDECDIESIVHFYFKDTPRDWDYEHFEYFVKDYIESLKNGIE